MQSPVSSNNSTCIYNWYFTCLFLSPLYVQNLLAVEFFLIHVEGLKIEGVAQIFASSKATSEAVKIKLTWGDIYTSFHTYLPHNSCMFMFACLCLALLSFFSCTVCLYLVLTVHFFLCTVWGHEELLKSRGKLPLCVNIPAETVDLSITWLRKIVKK